MIFKNSINQLTEEELIKIHIDEFLVSAERKLMIKGEKYYKVENDILNRKMYRYEDGEKVEDETKTNNKLAHGFMHEHVEDKVNYLLVKPYTFTCKDEAYLTIVKETLGKRFQKRMSRLGVEASNKGLAWLHVYIDAFGKFRTLLTPSEQCIPIWIDNDHEELQALIRFYDIEEYEGKTKKIVTKIEYWTPETVEYYTMLNGNVILDAERYLNDNDNYTGHFKVNNIPYSWEKVPFIPFKNNDFELPDLKFIKTLIDGYDISRSDIANLLEDIKNIIFALRGYGGEDLGEFMRDLAYYRAIKMDGDGGIDKVETTIDIDAAEKHYQALKKDIYAFGMAVDKDSDKFGNSPSGIALKFLYSGLDLKCNALEDCFKWSFEQLIFFVNMYLDKTNQKSSDVEIEIVFNRDIAINIDAAITNCKNSMGVISLETIIENHPWVKDVLKELKRIQSEQAKISDMFPDDNDDDNDEGDN